MPTKGIPNRDLSYAKPKQFQNYLTIAELGREVGYDISWLRRLEQAGKIPRATRTKQGVRLWSPAQVEEIKLIKSKQKVGRPRKNA